MKLQLVRHATLLLHYAGMRMKIAQRRAIVVLDS
jgi:hypothetical protein